MEWNRIKNGDTYKIAEERTGNTRSWSGSGLVVWRNYSAEKVLPSITVKIDKSPSQGEEWTIDTLASSINRRYLNVSSGNDNFSVSASSEASIRLRNTEKESSSLSVSYGVEYSNQHHTQLGLDYYAAFAGCSAETEASFETVVFLAEKTDELGLGAIMTIEGTDHSIAETVRDNTAAKDQEILTMDSLQSTTGKDAENGTSYLSVMTSNLEVLKQALK